MDGEESAADGGRAALRALRVEGVLDQASRHLNASGVTLRSLADIASRLGITRSALYGYVRDRQDLVFQCYWRSCDMMRARFVRAVEMYSDPFAIIAGFIRNVMDPALPEAAALGELGCLKPDQQLAIRRRQASLIRSIARTLLAGQRARTMCRRDPTIMAETILSLVFWLKLAPRWLGQETNLSPDRLELAAQRLLFDGIATGAAQVPTAFADPQRLALRSTDAWDRDSAAHIKLDRMLATASRLFNERGVGATSVDDIASLVGVTKRTLFNHFPDKQSLVYACTMRGLRIYTEIGVQASLWPGLRSEALGAAFYASTLASFRSELSPLRVFSGLGDLPEAANRHRETASAALQQVYNRLFEQGASEGSLHSIDMRATELAMTGLSHWVGACTTRRPERVALEITQLVLFGLRADR